MRVELKSLLPNPMRDFTVDPIDDEAVARLKDSIKESGFWGGVTCRRNKRGIEIAAGHHRVKAAIKAGISIADVFVSDDWNDAQMARVYATENATQRGNSGTAQAGSVATAIRFLAKAVITGNISGISDMSARGIETVRGKFQSGDGLGAVSVFQFLAGIPGIYKTTVEQQIANLKASGDYERIVRQVQTEIEEENREALKELKRQEAETAKRIAEQEEAEQRQREAEERRKEAAKAARVAKEEADKKRAQAEAERAELARQKAEAEAKLAEKRRQEAEKELKQFDALRATRDVGQRAVEAASGEITFDFEGVAKHLRAAFHIDVFRKLVTGEGIKPYLAVKQQAALAARLVALASKNDVELTARFIHENVGAMVLGVKAAGRRLDADEKAELLRRDWASKAKYYQKQFADGAGQMIGAAADLAAHAKDRPKGVSFLVSAEFRNAVENAEKAINIIRSKVL